LALIGHALVCGAEADELDRTGDAEGYNWVRHNKFKVAGSVLSTKLDANRAQWESAIEKAKARASAGEWPTIITTDF
jgi:hypothetical protein